MKTSLTICVKLILLGTVIFFISNQIDWANVVVKLKSFHPSAWLIGLCLVTLANAVAAYRWWAILKTMSSCVSLTNVFAAFYVQLFFAQAISNVGGDIVRVALLKKEGFSISSLFVSVLTDRAITLVALIALALGLRFALSQSMLNALPVPLLLLLFLISIFVKRHQREIRNIATKQRFVFHIHRLIPPIITICSSSRTLFICVIASFFGLSCLYSIVAIGLSTLGQEFSYIEIAPAVLMTIAVAMVPITFGGWGVREGTMVITLTPFGIDASSAVSVSIFLGLIILFGSLPGLVISLFFRLNSRSND